MTPFFFHHILAIDIFQIGQDKIFFEKRFLNQICGFFQHFLALFDPITTRYNDPAIKFEFCDQCQYIKHFISKKFLKID